MQQINYIPNLSTREDINIDRSNRKEVYGYLLVLYIFSVLNMNELIDQVLYR